MGAVTKNYFTDSELTHSDTAKKRKIKNEPNETQWQNLHALRDNVLNPARAEYGSCVYVNCAFRCPELNAIVGGEKNSQHTSGQAADITTKSKSGNLKLFAIIAQQGAFDQLIWEGNGSWIHVSYNTARQRGQILAQNTSGKGYTNITYNWKTQIV